MRYLRVRWLHDSRDDPVDLFSEIDDESWEVREVEVVADGSMHFAGGGLETGDTRLGDVPMTDFEEIAASPEFLPEMIDRAGFESVWERAHEAAKAGV